MRFKSACVSLYVFLLTFLPGMAWAIANPLDFDVPPTDLSKNYLSNIFGVVDGVLAGSGSQIMGQMFNVFNAAVLSIGAIIIMYTLVVSTLNTAQEGEFIGRKWSSIWIPVRSAAGIALLLPKASGYCLVQIIIMWVIVQGIGAADSIWNTALNYIQRGGVIIQQTLDTSEGTDFRELLPSAKKILQSEICMYGLQELLERDRKNKRQRGYEDPGPVPNFATTIDIYNPKKGPFEGAVEVIFPDVDEIAYPNYAGYTRACGSIGWKVITDEERARLGSLGLSGDLLNQASQARNVAVGQMIISLASTAQTMVRNEFRARQAQRLPLGHLEDGDWVGDPGAKPPKPTAPLLSGTEIQDAAISYVNIMGPTLRALDDQMQGGNNQIRFQFMKRAREQGWLLAGAYYFDLSNINTMASQVLGDEYKNLIPNPPGPLSSSKFDPLKKSKDLGTLNTLVNKNPTLRYLDDAAKYDLGYGRQKEAIDILAEVVEPQYGSKKDMTIDGCLDLKWHKDYNIADIYTLKVRLGKKVCLLPRPIKFSYDSNTIFCISILSLRAKRSTNLESSCKPVGPLVLTLPDSFPI